MCDWCARIPVPAQILIERKNPTRFFAQSCSPFNALRPNFIGVMSSGVTPFVFRFRVFFWGFPVFLSCFPFFSGVVMDGFVIMDGCIMVLCLWRWDDRLFAATWSEAGPASSLPGFMWPLCSFYWLDPSFLFYTEPSIYHISIVFRFFYTDGFLLHVYIPTIFTVLLFDGIKFNLWVLLVPFFQICG